MKNNVLVIVILVAVVAGGLWYKNTMSTKSTEDSTMKEESTTSATNTADKMTADAAREITVEGTEFKFMPATMVLKKGEKVRLTLKNTGKMPHDFVIDELGVKTKQITGGMTDTVEFTPDKAGTFEYYCSVGEHRAKGMKGMLTVE